MSECPSHYPRNHGQDLTDWFVSHGLSVADLVDLLPQAVTVDPPREPERDPGAARFFGGKNGNRFMPALLAQAIMEDVVIVSDPETNLVYRWEGRFWEIYDLAFIRQKALKMLGDEGSSARASDVSSMVRDLSTLPPGRSFNDHELICLRNGMFNLDTGEIVPHAREHFCNRILPIEFDPTNVKECPSWKRFLDQAVKDQVTIRELQKFFGYCLTKETRYEKMLLLYGPGGDGKSTVLKILKALIGEQNCTHIPMGRLDDQFYLSKLVGKLLNTFSEIESKAMQSQEIKAIISGDPISASFKNQTPFDFTPECKLAYSTNKPPRMLDNSDGFFRKVILIEMTEQFYKKGLADENLFESLLEELDGIFAWALAGWVMLREDRGFRPSEAMLRSLENYRVMNNNILYYIEKHIQADPQGKAGKEKVYEDYAKRCRTWNLLPVGEPQFRLEFLRLLRDRDVEVRDGKLPRDEVKGVRPNAYAGLRIVEEKGQGEDIFDPPLPPPPEAPHE